MAKSKARLLADIQKEFYDKDDVSTFTRSTFRTNSTNEQVILSINIDKIDAFVFHIKCSAGTDRQMSSINTILEGTTVYMTEYGEIRTGDLLSTYDVDISGSILRLKATPTNATTNFTIVRINL